MAKKVISHCVYCGEKVESTTPLKKAICKHCHGEFMKVANRIRARFVRGVITREEVHPLIDAIMVGWAIEDVKHRNERKANPKVIRPVTHCKWCGRETRSEDGFCCYCRSEGFNNVYEALGHSNGWEKRGVVGAVKVVSGWRGRPVAGGKTLRARMSAD